MAPFRGGKYVFLLEAQTHAPGGEPLYHSFSTHQIAASRMNSLNLGAVGFHLQRVQREECGIHPTSTTATATSSRQALSCIYVGLLHVVALSSRVRTFFCIFHHSLSLSHALLLVAVALFSHTHTAFTFRDLDFYASFYAVLLPSRVSRHCDGALHRERFHFLPFACSSFDSFEVFISK